MENEIKELQETSLNELGNESDTEFSDSNLEIDLNEAVELQKPQSPIANSNEQEVIKRLEDEIVKQLDEKAEKIKLTVKNVKTIIRQVFKHEHVRTLLTREQESEDVKELVSRYEPKLTRAKAKQLFSSTPIPPVPAPWVPQPLPSETHVLIGEDLKEEDSGEEYVPGEEESEDDNNESVTSESDIGSLPPPTPPTPVAMEDCATQTTNWTEDGVFKIPLPKTAQEQEESANIALRTRSKINLSSTPLEEIEKSFIPPDITIDMYDMDCDDDVWKEFLKGFTEPLEEVTKPTEDDDHDPEYNILADDEIDQVDHEDFREDKAVKITKKEVKQLWDELFEYVQDLSEEYEDKTLIDSLSISNKTEVVYYNSAVDVIQEQSCTEEVRLKNIEQTDSEDTEKTASTDKKIPKYTIEYQQICILEQQIRQHVQMLTQNFLLCYDHVEFHHYSITCTEYLSNLELLGEGKMFSLFRPVNLLPAIKLVESWVKLFASNTQEVKETKEHVENEIFKSLQSKMAGNWTRVLTFPRLILDTISKSEVFLYPSLLPKIPFKSEQFFLNSKVGFTNAEDSLLVFGLDQFTDYLENELKIKKVTLTHKVEYVQEYMMPHKNTYSILKHISHCKHPRCATNPIQQYILYGKVKPVIHYLHPLNQIVPPCKRLPEELPYQWKTFLYPNLEDNSATKNDIKAVPNLNLSPQVIIINSPLTDSSLLYSPVILCNPKTPSLRKKKSTPGSVWKTKRGKTRRQIKFHKPEKPLNSNVTSVERFVWIFLQPISVQKLIKLMSEIELLELKKKPSFKGCIRENYGRAKMINIDMSVKSICDNNETTMFNQPCTNPSNGQNSLLHCENKSNYEYCLKNVEEDNNSSVVMKSKLNGQFFSNSSIDTPAKGHESEEYKSKMFALSFYNKLHETLDLKDYLRVMQVLEEFQPVDITDLFYDIHFILTPKYENLAEEFIDYLENKEFSVMNQLIPWLEAQARLKFCHQLEVVFKDKQEHLKKIYFMLMELTKMKNLSLAKIKNVLLRMLKDNDALINLVLMNFRDKRIRQETEEAPEKNDESQCHCHKLKDNGDENKFIHTNSIIEVNSQTNIKTSLSVAKSCSERMFNNSTSMQSRSNELEQIDQTNSDTSLNKSLSEEVTKSQTPSHSEKILNNSINMQSSSNEPKQINQDIKEKIGKRKKFKSLLPVKKRQKSHSPKSQTRLGNNINKVDCLKDKIKITNRHCDEESTKLSEKIMEELSMKKDKQEHDENQKTLADNYKDSFGETLQKVPISVNTKQLPNSTIKEELAWKREEDMLILETFQKKDKEYALQIIADKLPHRTKDNISARFSNLMDLLLETINQS